MDKFEELRNKYDTFIYDKYEIIETINNYEITYYFTIKDLTTFKPKLIIPKKRNDIDEIFFWIPCLPYRTNRTNKLL